MKRPYYRKLLNCQITKAEIVRTCTYMSVLYSIVCVQNTSMHDDQVWPLQYDLYTCGIDICTKYLPSLLIRIFTCALYLGNRNERVSVFGMSFVKFSLHVDQLISVNIHLSIIHTNRLGTYNVCFSGTYYTGYLGELLSACMCNGVVTV